jgi:PAS domain S-box-containing protein
MYGWNAGRGTSCAPKDNERVRVASRSDLHVGALAASSRELTGPPRELVSSLGHELKTPLSIVLGLCGRLLAAGGLDEPRSEDVERIRANAYVLLKRVEELLQVARLDAGRPDLDVRRVDVAELVREILAGFASVAELRGQQLELAAAPVLEADVDQEKLLSVVSNLVANALKFAPAGGRVRVGLVAARRRLRLEVADSGPGVPVGLRAEVFERFDRGAPSAAQPAGTGLGLAIVRELVALHGGTVTLGEAPEGGALFVVELPLRRSGAGRRRRARPAALIDIGERQRATVEELRAELRAVARRNGHAAQEAEQAGRPGALVVTTDDELGAYLGELLRPEHRPTQARSALEAARMLGASPPDAVIVDADTGVETVSALRRRGRGAPILALAAAADDVRALVEAGADDCVVKPFAEDELLARLDALVVRGRSDLARAPVIAGLGHAFDAAPTSMALVTAEGRFVRVNRALCALLGLQDDELLARCTRDVVHPDELADEAMRRDELLAGRVAVDHDEWRLHRADGSWLRTRVSASVVGADDDERGLLLWQLSGAPHDELRVDGHTASGAGRRAFDRAVRHQMLRCERYGEQASLVRCSLPDLEGVRREHGPQAAERLVERILAAVRRRLRDTDVVAQVGERDLAALLAHADADAAATAAAGLREAAERERVVTPGGPVGTRAAVGVVPVARAASPARAFFEAGLALQAGDERPARSRQPVS